MTKTKDNRSMNKRLLEEEIKELTDEQARDVRLILFGLRRISNKNKQNSV